jgi:hypothetical protein
MLSDTIAHAQAVIPSNASSYLSASATTVRCLGELERASTCWKPACASSYSRSMVTYSCSHGSVLLKSENSSGFRTMRWKPGAVGSCSTMKSIMVSRDEGHRGGSSCRGELTMSMKPMAPPGLSTRWASRKSARATVAQGQRRSVRRDKRGSDVQVRVQVRYKYEKYKCKCKCKCKYKYKCK